VSKMARCLLHRRIFSSFFLLFSTSLKTCSQSQVKNRVKIGAGAMILGNIPLGNDVVVGAAAIVTIPINEGETVVGINRVLSKEQKQAAVSANKGVDTWLYDI
jgi:serine acetyltransferase